MILNAEIISKKYMRKSGEANFFYAVRETSLALTAGSITGVIGRSGSGKSTLLNMMAGLLSPSAGKVTLDGTDLYALSDKELSVLRNQNIGVIPQGQTGLDSLTALDNIKLPYALYHNDRQIDDRADELLHAVGIAHLADAYPSELSGGELRRLAIARALIMQPGIILADEPTGDLDDENTATVLGLLRKAADDGAAVLLVTHDADARQYADVLYRMDAGVLAEA
ncbi:MAG: ABC transporter ATP-binding protein [Clostridia bacterium]|nr:ABC transporter ATP-binding protein [Clostridia bacterium]